MKLAFLEQRSMMQLASGAEMGRLVVAKCSEWRWCHGDIGVATRWLVKSIREIHAGWSRAMQLANRKLSKAMWSTVMTSALQCYHENGAFHADGTPMPGWGAVFHWMCSVLQH